MPALLDGAKSREKIFDTLNQTGSHFIAVEGSGSSSSETDQSDIEQQARQVAGSSGSGAGKGEESRRKQRGDERNSSRHSSAQQKKQAKPTPPDLLAREGSMSVRYSRVTSANGNNPITEAEHVKRRRSQLSDKISTKLHAFFWVLAGVMVAYQTDFVRVLMESDRVNRVWFNIAVTCFSINVVIMGYLAVWLPYVKRIKVSWNLYSPRAIPTATAVGLICAVALNISLWNVWGFLTPLILFAVFVGCLFSLHFVPWPC